MEAQAHVGSENKLITIRQLPSPRELACVHQRGLYESLRSATPPAEDVKVNDVQETIPAEDKLSMEDLRRENAQLRLQVQELQQNLNQKEIALVSARVVDTRLVARKGNKERTEYKLEIQTDTRGRLHAWHRYSTFQNLATALKKKYGNEEEGVPELPDKKRFDLEGIPTRLEQLDAFLTTITGASHLQFGVRVDPDTCVYKRRVKSAPNSTLRSGSWGFQTKYDAMFENELVLSAKVVGSLQRAQVEQTIVEYQLQIETAGRNTILVWHRYDALCDWVRGFSSRHQVPQLPRMTLFKAFSSHMESQQVKALDEVFKKAIESEHIQWCVRIEENTCVFKLKEASSASTRTPPTQGAAVAEAAQQPRAARGRSFSLTSLFKTKPQRKKCDDAQSLERKVTQGG